MPRPRIDLPDGLSAEEHEARRRERGFNAGIYAVSIGLTRTTYLNKVRHLIPRRALPNGFRRCLKCRQPYEVGSSPVTRACGGCHSNPDKAPRGSLRCLHCHVEVKVEESFGQCCSQKCQAARLRERRNTLRGRLNLCLQKARKRNTCSIDLEWLLSQWEKQAGRCYYTGWLMQLSGVTALRPTIERLNSDVGYTSENVVLACRQANWAKNDYTLVEFLEMCQAVTLKHGKSDATQAA